MCTSGVNLDISEILSNPKSDTNKNVPNLSKLFWLPLIVQMFVIIHYTYKLFPVCPMFCHCEQSLPLLAIPFTELCSINPNVKKCVKFAIGNALSKNYPRKYWIDDRSPNRIRTFLDVQNFWTPIYTSSVYHCASCAIHYREV